MSPLEPRVCELAEVSRYFQNDRTVFNQRSNCVKVILRFAIIAVLISSGVLPATARRKPAREPTPNKAHIEAATRLQIFLDRNNFSPGKLDGRYNEFTWKALALYRESRGEQLQILPPQGNHFLHCHGCRSCERRPVAEQRFRAGQIKISSLSRCSRRHRREVPQRCSFAGAT